ncbi:hypothetical protein SXIM_00120 [Streptomyces xiamenensis]|uniref:Uncharacterized protein n=1 Tax=Streptomyces xiamenensis TaxID=408015 RepID=A0A0F7CMM0_9ACTN|nr:hypothetical protein SXIM_00120 [Streptomyces xiamenensis]
MPATSPTHEPSPHSDQHGLLARARTYLGAVIAKANLIPRP